MSEQQIIDIEATVIESTPDSGQSVSIVSQWEDPKPDQPEGTLTVGSTPDFSGIDTALTDAGFEHIGTIAPGSVPMDPEKQTRLEASGWSVGTADEFLDTLPILPEKRPRKKPCKPVRAFESDGTPVPPKPKKKRRRYSPKIEKGMGKEEAKLARKAFDTTGNENYPWYPQGEETAQAYIYFKAYLDLGPMRTYKQIREILKLNAEHLRLWAKRYNWDERVQAYNDHIVALEFINREKVIADKAAEDAEKWLGRRDEIREKAYLNANQLIDVAMEMLSYPRTSQETFEDKVEIDGKSGNETIVRYTTLIMPTKWTLRDVSAFLKEADRLQRMAAEMATSNQKITVEQQSTDLTFEMLLDFVKSGKAIPEARQQMISVLLMDPVHVDAAIQRMQDGAAPIKQITGTRLDD